MSDRSALYQYLLLLGDNSLILGHRLSELCGHGPSLETDIALTNISLDLFGQVRNYFQYAAKVAGGDKSEDDIAFLRYPHEYRNVCLVEQPNTDFAFVIARQFLFDTYHLLLLEELMNSQDEQIAAIAHKSIKEVKYHHRFSSEWVKRLGDGTKESQERMQAALDHSWPYAEELLQKSLVEIEMKDLGIGADLGAIESLYWSSLQLTLEKARLDIPQKKTIPWAGKEGTHTEHLGYILADLQYMQRAYPSMTW